MIIALKKVDRNAKFKKEEKKGKKVLFTCSEVYCDFRFIHKFYSLKEKWALLPDVEILMCPTEIKHSINQSINQSDDLSLIYSFIYFCISG